jgi:hypothetical protein
LMVTEEENIDRCCVCHVGVSTHGCGRVWWWCTKNPLWQHSPRVCLFRGLCILIEFNNVRPASGVSPGDTSRGDSRNACRAIGLAKLFPSQGRGGDEGED